MIYDYGQHRPKLHERVYVAPGVHLIGNITIGKDSSVWFNSVLRGDNDAIVIGEHSNIQDGCVLHVDEGAPIIIGNDVTVGHNVILHGCTIRNGALIGMGAIILNHAEIGEEALIAAGSLIPEGKKIPPRSLVVGSPGKVVRELTDKDLQRMRSGAAHYADKGKSYHSAGIY